jgi:NAD(P)-dependent dehydrogenase (short-subunit alcohol dehydrogenase family)
VNVPVPSLFDLNDKVALVTGGATGIGRSCAIALAASGAHVAIVDSNGELGRKTAAAIERSGRKSMFVACDVTQQQQVEAMVIAVARSLGRLDIAVNNAGIYRAGADESYAKTDWDHVLAVNLTGTWLCAQAEMRQMAQQTPAGGKIINMASIGAHIACSNGAYDASKAGVLHLSRTLAARWGRYNINVNSISPGYVETVFGNARSDDERRRLREMTPLGYVQRLEDLHGPLLFLASPASDYVTGQDLVVDGGHTLGTWMNPLERSVPPRVDST